MSKILIFSIPPINKNNNNTFELLFKSAAKKHDLFFLSCRDGENKSNVFSEIYTLSESRAIKSIFNNKIDVFQKVDCSSTNSELNIYKNNNHFHNLKRIFRDFLWILSKWKRSSLKNFLESQSFDYVVAPSEGYHYYLRILKYICKITKAKLVLYTWDDNFTFKQRQLSPLFFFYRMKTRFLLKYIAKHFLYKTLAISEKTKRESDTFFGSNSIILKKTISERTLTHDISVQKGIRIIYGGNLLNGRDKSLLQVAAAIQDKPFEALTLDIYSNISNKRIYKKLSKFKNVFIHNPITHYELLQEESNSSVGLMLESLSYTKKKISRLSISTKFTDYIGSGLPIFAIIDGESATALEIKENNLGCVASKKKDIQKSLLKIIDSLNRGIYKKSISNYKKKYDSKTQDSIIDQLFL